MAFKMKAGKEGPMKKNFPGAFKKEEQQGSVKKTSKFKQGVKNIVKKVKDQFTSMEPSKDFMYSNRVTKEGEDMAKQSR